MDTYYNLYNLLNNKSYYSVEINYTAKQLNIPVSMLYDIQCDPQFEKNCQDILNIFIYNDITYIGFPCGGI